MVWIGCTQRRTVYKNRLCRYLHETSRLYWYKYLIYTYHTCWITLEFKTFLFMCSCIYILVICLESWNILIALLCHNLMKVQRFVLVKIFSIHSIQFYCKSSIMLSSVFMDHFHSLHFCKFYRKVKSSHRCLCIVLKSTLRPIINHINGFRMSKMNNYEQLNTLWLVYIFYN